MKIICICILLSASIIVTGQDKNTNPNYFNLSLTSGISKFSVKDHNISSQRYLGSLRPIIFNWKHKREGYEWNLVMSYSSGTIKNYHVAATLNDFNLSWNYLYPIKEFTLFSNRPTIWFGGFSPNLWMYYRKQKIAEPGQFLYSVKFIFSMGLNTGIRGSLSKKFDYELISHFNALSYGISSDIDEGNTEITGKLSTVFSTPLFNWKMAIHYQALSWVKVGLGYQFKYYNHESLKLASDSFMITMSAIF